MTLSTARAHAAALATTLVGYLVAFLPNFAADKQILISAGGVLLAGVILISHAIRNRTAGSSVTGATKAEILSAVSQLDLNSIVRTELAHIATGTPPTTTTARFDPVTGQPVAGAHA